MHYFRVMKINKRNCPIYEKKSARFFVRVFLFLPGFLSQQSNIFIVSLSSKKKTNLKFYDIEFLSQIGKDKIKEDVSNYFLYSCKRI